VQSQTFNSTLSVSPVAAGCGRGGNHLLMASETRADRREDYFAPLTMPASVSYSTSLKEKWPGSRNSRTTDFLTESLGLL
jgi:hypothetical protein